MAAWNFLDLWFTQEQPPTPPPKDPPPVPPKDTPPQPPACSATASTMANITYHDPPHRLPQQTFNCWLTRIRICYSDPDFYTYTVTLSGNTFPAECYVPKEQVNADTQRDLRNGRDVFIDANNESKATCTARDLVGEDEAKKAYVRSIRVKFRNNEYVGFMYIAASTSEGKRYARMINGEAVKSIEPEEQQPPPRRTVEFLGPIKLGNVRTEVWSLDGERFHRGGSSVLKVKIRGGRKYLTIRAAVDRGVYAYLVGDVANDEWARCARFQEVDSPEKKASSLFNMPDWVMRP